MPAFNPDGRERAIDQLVQPHQAPAQHRAGAARDPDAAALERFERQRRGRDQVAKLVREVAEILGRALRVSLGDVVLAQPRVLRHRAGDGVVETQVECLKVRGGDRGALLDRHLGDRLTHVSIVVDDLRDREALTQEVRAVLRRRSADGTLVFELRLQRGRELIEEQRDAVLELVRGGPRCHASADARAATLDDLLPIRGHELAQHGTPGSAARTQDYDATATQLRS